MEGEQSNNIILETAIKHRITEEEIEMWIEIIANIYDAGADRDLILRVFERHPALRRVIRNMDIPKRKTLRKCNSSGNDVCEEEATYEWDELDFYEYD